MAIIMAGGCLCGQVRYEAHAPPTMAGFCCCSDCRKASGSGFIPFMGFAAEDLAITGRTVRYDSKALVGTATRNRCSFCGGLVFGGIAGVHREHTVYAGSLDDPSNFRPTVAIFVQGKPRWVELPAGLTMFDTMP